MSRISFKTGKDHQEAAATWARQRLADGGGRRFSTPGDQDGVLFADGVGMGKTWEALAAATLILYKTKPQRGLRHVLILCPPNLVTKWEDELAAGSKFHDKLARWCRGMNGRGRVYAQRVVETLTNTLPIRRAQHVITRKTRRRFLPPGGTYIVSQNLMARREGRLNALKRLDWDVVIVDEAHNAAALKAIDAVESRRRIHTKLLLSATPFQLQPRQWNKLAHHLIKGGKPIFSRGEVSEYVKDVDAVFRDATQPGPTAAVVATASELLRRISARSVLKHSRRCYEVIRRDDEPLRLPGKLDELDDESVRRFLLELAGTRGVAAFPEFGSAYLEHRLKLAAGGAEKTFVATALRRFLSTGRSDAASPRMEALERWAKAAFAEDIDSAIRLGKPHKTIVFSSWVGALGTGEAARLQQLLAKCFDSALRTSRKKHARWAAWKKRGLERLREAFVTEEPALAEIYRALAEDELTVVVAGANPSFVPRVIETALLQKAALERLQAQLDAQDDRRSIEARALQRRRNDLRIALNPWAGSGPTPTVGRYTGSEQRTERDRTATAFRHLGPPWVLVASQVGSEGIDLQTYTHRIVHYDLEWNPARMEQREGRGDREGRELTTHLHVSYCLVPNTYDERMFHQLVARDRWHGVLLGSPAQALDGDGAQAPLLIRKRLAKMRLQLAP